MFLNLSRFRIFKLESEFISCKSWPEVFYFQRISTGYIAYSMIISIKNIALKYHFCCKGTERERVINSLGPNDFIFDVFLQTY